MGGCIKAVYRSLYSQTKRSVAGVRDENDCRRLYNTPAPNESNLDTKCESETLDSLNLRQDGVRRCDGR